MEHVLTEEEVETRLLQAASFGGTGAASDAVWRWYEHGTLPPRRYPAALSAVGVVWDGTHYYREVGEDGE
jgi:hypothetical protein